MGLVWGALSLPSYLVPVINGLLGGCLTATGHLGGTLGALNSAFPVIVVT